VSPSVAAKATCERSGLNNCGSMTLSASPAVEIDPITHPEEVREKNSGGAPNAETWFEEHTERREGEVFTIACGQLTVPVFFE
jgi:hypothetical protein